jgi:A/G-specific adenine glycosylase
LLAWYREHKRDLPWRIDRDPYRVWISEAMLQQTRVETVIDYYRRFMARFPTLAALAEAPIDDVLAAWSGLGYYRRARTLQAAARAIVAQHGGEFPRDREALLALPGIGRYTAGAIASIAFEGREPVVDGNVARVFCRLFAIDGNPTSSPGNAELWTRARSLLPSRGSCGDWNQALMELGALVCTPRDPRCGDCPLRSECRALETDRVGELPRSRSQPAPIDVELCVIVCAKEERWLLERRPASGRMAGMWQFPTIEIGSGGVRARTNVSGGHLHPTRWPEGIDFELGELLGELRHTITHHRIRAVVHVARLARDSRSSRRAIDGSGDDRSSSFAWFDRTRIDALPLTGMARKVLRACFLAILPAPEEAPPATSRRRSPSKRNAND